MSISDLSSTKGYKNFAHNRLFRPLRFCGRQWTWVNNTANDKISQIALKILAIPFLTVATLLAMIPFSIGALFFPAVLIPSQIEHNPVGVLHLINANNNDKELASTLSEEFQKKGYTFSISTSSKTSLENIYEDSLRVGRAITIQDPQSSAVRRFWKAIKYHFNNKNITDLINVYPCLSSNKQKESLEKLADILALHKAVTIDVPFNAEYVKVATGFPLQSRR